MKFIDNTIRFLREVQAELKSVTWPTKDDLKEGTIVVISMSVLVAIFLSIVDYIFGWIVTKVL